MTKLLLLTVTSVLLQDAAIPEASKPVNLTLEANAPRLRREDVSAIFAAHYDATTFPMLAREEVRRSLEEPAYREFHWVLTGTLIHRLLMTPYDVVGYIRMTRGSDGVVGSDESYRQLFEGQKVSGIAYPDTPIRFLTARPVDFLGDWITAPTSKFESDPYSDHIFAVARCIVEVENGKYREITIKWMYVPGREKFMPVGGRYETIRDPLTMLMRLHDVETR